MEIQEFLKYHTIVSIGKVLPGYIACEVLVDNPREMVSVARENNCYISEIRWWDRAQITLGSSIGYGGPRDPFSPDSHFFAETDIFKSFTPDSEDNDLYAYLVQIQNTFPHLDLFPAFDIRKRNTGDGSPVPTAPI